MYTVPSFASIHEPGLLLGGHHSDEVEAPDEVEVPDEMGINIM